MVSDPRFHCGGDPQGLMNANEAGNAESLVVWSRRLFL